MTGVDRRVSKKGNAWAIVTIEDMESSIQCMFFGKVYEAAAADLAIDTVVRIRGMVEVRDESVSLRATEMDVPTLEAADERPLVITLPQMALNRAHVMLWYFIPESRHTIAKQEIIKRLTEVALCSYFTAAGQNKKITIPLTPARRQAACSRRSSWQNER